MNQGPQTPVARGAIDIEDGISPVETGAAEETGNENRGIATRPPFGEGFVTSLPIISIPTDIVKLIFGNSIDFLEIRCEHREKGPPRPARERILRCKS
jgi:hypothetical protein